jgi:hypothetical protein
VNSVPRCVSLFHSSTVVRNSEAVVEEELVRPDHHVPKRRHTDFDGIVVSDKVYNMKMFYILLSLRSQ